MRKSSRGNPYHDERGRFCSGPKSGKPYTTSERTAEEYDERTKERFGENSTIPPYQPLSDEEYDSWQPTEYESFTVYEGNACDFDEDIDDEDDVEYIPILQKDGVYIGCIDAHEHNYEYVITNNPHAATGNSYLKNEDCISPVAMSFADEEQAMEFLAMDKNGKLTKYMQGKGLFFGADGGELVLCKESDEDADIIKEFHWATAPTKLGKQGHVIGRFGKFQDLYHAIVNSED